MERIAENRTSSAGSRRRIDIVDAVAPGMSLAAAKPKTSLHRPGMSLFQQQCWNWGQDVRRTGGNLLLEYGFEKSSPPKLEWGSSCYSFVLGPHSVIRLWGFGLMHCDERHGSLFMLRPTFEPKLGDATTPTSDVWRPDQITRLRTPRLPQDGDSVLHLLPPLLAWIGAYEQWVLDTFGVEYRDATLNGWDERVVDPEEVPGEWWAIAAGWRELLIA